MVLNLKNLFLYLLLFLILLTSLRNLTPIYFVGVILLIMIYSLRALVINAPIKTGTTAILFYLFCFYTILVIFWSAIYMQSFEFVPAIPRVLLIIVFSMIVLLNYQNESKFRGFLFVLLCCYLIGAISIIYQVINERPIAWFASMVGRADLNRYSSILGSVTIYGSVAGYPVLLLLSKVKLFKSKAVSFSLLIVIISAAFLSLSKTAVMTLIIAFFLFAIFHFREFIKDKMNIKSIAFLLISILLIFIFIKSVPILNNHFNTIVSQTFGGNNIFTDNSSVMIDSRKVSLDHIYFRLFNWTTDMITHYGNLVYFTGVGVMGAGGTLGMHNYAMAHTALGDIFFMGGFPYLFIFLGLYFNVQYNLLLTIKNNTSKLFFMMNLLYFANLLIASGSVFHPSISAPFWISMVYVILENQKIKNNINFLPNSKRSLA